MSVLITGAAGFIGFHLSKRLIEDSIPVIGFDNLNPYYDPKLKKARLNRLQELARENEDLFKLLISSLIWLISIDFLSASTSIKVKLGLDPLLIN